MKAVKLECAYRQDWLYRVERAPLSHFFHCLVQSSRNHELHVFFQGLRVMHLSTSICVHCAFVSKTTYSSLCCSSCACFSFSSSGSSAHILSTFQGVVCFLPPLDFKRRTETKPRHHLISSCRACLTLPSRSIPPHVVDKDVLCQTSSM